jgi:hypothetical protein
MRFPRFPRFAVLTLLGILLLAAPLFAAGYAIYLKDGSRILAKQKYTVDKGRAIIILLNGTQTFVPLSQLDVKRTEDANKEGHGDALVLPGTPQDVGPSTAQPPKEKTLSDLVASREAAPRTLPESRRERTETPGGGIARTKAGFVDFATVARKPYPNAEVTAELQQFFHGQGTEEVEIYQGTRADQPLLEITTNSEGSVFKALGTAANALLHVRDAFPNRVAAFELLLTTPERERAGQFVLTPEMATDLVAKKVDVTAFFVKHVQF